MELLGLLGLVLAIIALVNANTANRRTEDLERALRALSGRFAAGTRAETPAEAGAPSQVAAVAEESPAPPAPEPASFVEEPRVDPQPAPKIEAPKTESLEETLTSRWLVWVGAVTIALAGTFLVRYAIDQGYLGPTARVTLGFLLGMVLTFAGEWLRRRPLERAIAAIRTNHVPPALTASGLFIAFASIYAAYALYQLLPAVAAFAGLAVVALLAVALSLLQGPFVAMMGVLGAFWAPALVRTEHPSAWTLFLYLFIVEAACLAVARTQRWWWFAAAALAGAMAWPLLWMLPPHFDAADGLPLGLYILATALSFIALRRGLPEPEGKREWLEEILGFEPVEWVACAAAATCALVMLIVLRLCDYGPEVLALAWLLCALYIAAGRRYAALDSLPVAGALVAIAIAGTMPMPQQIVTPPFYHPGPFVPFELQYFAATAIAFGALFAISGFALLWGAKRPALWAAISAAVPLTLLVIAYGRIVDFGVDLSWAGIALALAALNLFAAERVERYRTARGLDVTLGFYASAVVASISLAAAMSMRQAWLTVALSLQLPALAWIHARLRTPSLQLIAAIVAFTVLVRLALNYNVLNYPSGDNWLTSWVIYGYGVPALAFFAAARLFRGCNAERLVPLLEAGGTAFGALLVSLEIRLFVTGSLSTPSYGLLEESLQTISWLAIGSGLALHYRRSLNPVSQWGAAILLWLAGAQIVLLQLLVSNPFAAQSDVGQFPVLNVLFLAYAMPALFAFLYARAVAGTKFAFAAPLLAGAGFILLFVYLSFEVTRGFEGPVFDWAHHGDAELYAYSILWLVYAAALLVMGIVSKRSMLRYASLAVLVVTILKVFLVDMAGLTGLYRVGSFLGLGLSLLGIGYVYQRFVFPGPEKPAA